MDSETAAYVNEPPERDIGPNTNRNVIIRDLRQMANDFSNTNLGVEMNKMKKIENIYAITENAAIGSTARKAETFKAQIKEKKLVLDELVKTNGKLQSGHRRREPFAITDGSGLDLQDVNIDQRLLDMEERIVEAKAVVALQDDEGLLDTLTSYHEAFKNSLESLENIAKNRTSTTLPQIHNLRQFIEDTEKTITVDCKQHDPEVVKVLEELKRLNKYNTFGPDKLPFVEPMASDFEEELARLDLISGIDIVDDDNVFEVPLSDFLQNYSRTKAESAKSVMMKMDDANRKKPSKMKLPKPTRQKLDGRINRKK